MVTQLTVQSVLTKAIQKEIDSQNLYRNLGEKMTNEVAKDAFRKLARQEQKHQDILEQYRRGELKKGALSSDHVIDYKIAEYLEQPEISPDMGLKEVFLLAANREKASHEFYLGLAGIHPQGEVRRMLEGLAAQELGHKQKVESLYTDVAFPQTDGG